MTFLVICSKSSCRRKSKLYLLYILSYFLKSFSCFFINSSIAGRFAQRVAGVASRHPPRPRSDAPRRRRRADGTARRPCRRSPWRAPRATGSSLDRHRLQLLGLDALHPRAAPSSSRRSSCARSNGRPSAVPCSSTRRPPLVITTLTTSALESSV